MLTFLAYLEEWVHLALRFLHIITGIAWIGASFYFNWLENNIYRKEQREGIAGHLWAVHGGGYYYLEKYKKYPDQQPPNLHWFKWEAYFTWISGFCLLIFLYYLNAETYLLSSQSAITVSASHAVLLSVLGLIGSWLLYDTMCRSALIRYPMVFTLLLFSFVPIFAYLYGLVFAPRAVFIQIGSMIGTIMVANVFFVIMPVQKKLVLACDEKKEVSSELGLHGYRRSRHNNYFTLPVLLMMISGHYPHLSSGDYTPLALMLIFMIAVLIRHIFNLRGEGKSFRNTLIVTLLLLGSLIFFMQPKSSSELAGQQVEFSQVRQVINKHCVHCHSATPKSHSGFTKPPLGFMLDSDERIRKGEKLIYQNTVLSQSMPLGNLTNMNSEEREVLKLWYLNKK